MQYTFENRKTPFFISKPRHFWPTPHIHPHLELIYLTKGSCMTYIDGEQFLLKPNLFFIAFPNQIHFYHDQCPVEGYLIIFAPDFFDDLKDVFRNQIPTSPIIQLGCTPTEMIPQLEVIYQKSKSELSLDKVIANGHLLALLGELLSKTQLIDAPTDYDNVKKLLVYCSENYTEPLDLETVSQKLHLSKFYISHIFSNKLHVSFTDFINTLRVEHACNHLKKGANITDVALSSGFTSIRTFNRVFMNQMKMTPREYIKQKDRLLST